MSDKTPGVAVAMLGFSADMCLYSVLSESEMSNLPVWAATTILAASIDTTSPEMSDGFNWPNVMAEKARINAITIVCRSILIRSQESPENTRSNTQNLFNHRD